LLNAPMRDLADPIDREALQAEDMIYGVPVVVGTRKGFPNFNEFEMETSVSVTRKLEFVAPILRDPKFTRPVQSNQMYLIAISNVFGLEAWNSYSNAYPSPLQVVVDTEITT